MRNKRIKFFGLISLLLFSSLTINSSDLFQSFNFEGTAFSETLTQKFLQATQKDQCNDALGMLNDPSTLSKIDINAKTANGSTCLMCSCIKEHVKLVEKLLSLKKIDGSPLVDVDAQSIDGNTALICASFNGSLPIIEQLLSLKKTDGTSYIDIDKKGAFGMTALNWAYKNDRQDIVKVLDPDLAVRYESPCLTQQLVEEINIVAHLLATPSDYERTYREAKDHLKRNVFR